MVCSRTCAERHILHFMEHAVEFACKSCIMIADRRMRRRRKIDIVLQHVFAREIILHILELLRRTDEFKAIHGKIAVIMCRSRTARRATDMDIAFSTGRAGCIAEVFCVRTCADLDIRRRDIRRVQDAYTLPFKHDLVRRYTVACAVDETDDLCLCRIRRSSRRRIDDGAFLRGQRRAVLCHSRTDGIDIN